MLDMELSSSTTARFSSRLCDFCRTNLDAARLGAPVRVCVSQRDGEDTRIDMDLPSAFFSKFPEIRPSSVPALLDEKLIRSSTMRLPRGASQRRDHGGTNILNLRCYGCYRWRDG